eukprot:7323484-Alexandrium_andersonii.AAC.1
MHGRRVPSSSRPSEPTGPSGPQRLLGRDRKHRNDRTQSRRHCPCVALAAIARSLSFQARRRPEHHQSEL